MIPKPNLDDRTHRQIVEEAIRLIRNIVLNGPITIPMIPALP